MIKNVAKSVKESMKECCRVSDLTVSDMEKSSLTVHSIQVKGTDETMDPISSKVVTVGDMNNSRLL